MSFNDEELEHIEDLISGLNLGTAKIQLGRIFVRLLDRVEELEKNSGGEDGPASVTVDGISDASTIGKSVLKAASQAAARTAIGAIAASDVPAAPTWGTLSGKPSTYPPDIGTTASTAMAGNTPIPAAPTWGNISGKPAVVAAGADQAAARQVIGAGTSSVVVGTGAAQAASGTHNHAVTADAGSGLAAAANIQALAVALSTRIKTLEDAEAAG